MNLLLNSFIKLVFLRKKKEKLKENFYDHYRIKILKSIIYWRSFKGFSVVIASSTPTPVVMLLKPLETV